MHPDEEILASIALGEEVPAAEATHAAGCPECRAVVAELQETLQLAHSASGEALVAPPDSVWRAVSAEAGIDSGSVAQPAAPASAGGAVDELARRRSRGLTWLVGGVVGLAAGLAIATVGPGLLTPAPTVVATTRLDTLDTGTPGGDAELLARRDASLDLRITVKPLDAGGGFLEVWLINKDLKRMVSVGVLPNGSTSQDFTVTSRLIEQGYVIVDISREALDDRPEHSGDSLLRGSLA